MCTEHLRFHPSFLISFPCVPPSLPPLPPLPPPAPWFLGVSPAHYGLNNTLSPWVLAHLVLIPESLCHNDRAIPPSAATSVQQFRSRAVVKLGLSSKSIMVCVQTLKKVNRNVKKEVGRSYGRWVGNERYFFREKGFCWLEKRGEGDKKRWNQRSGDSCLRCR